MRKLFFLACFLTATIYFGQNKENTISKPNKEYAKDSPEWVFIKAQNCFVHGDIDSLVTFLHPIQLEYFKNAMLASLSDSINAKQLKSIYSDYKNLNEIKYIPADRFMSMFFKYLFNKMPLIKKVNAATRFKIVGHINSDSAAVYIIYKVIQQYLTLKDSTVLFGLCKKYNNIWKASLPASLNNAFLSFIKNSDHNSGLETPLTEQDIIASGSFPKGSPGWVGNEGLKYTKASDYDNFTLLMHPTAIKKQAAYLKKLLNEEVFDEEIAPNNSEYKSYNEFINLSDMKLFSFFFKYSPFKIDVLTNALKNSKFAILGYIIENDTTAYAITKIHAYVNGAQYIMTDLIKFLKYNGDWKMLLRKEPETEFN